MTNWHTNQLFYDYHLILEDGYRLSTNKFDTYCSLVVKYATPGWATNRWKIFSEATILEFLLETRFGLPKEYLVGAFEILPHPFQLMYLAKAEKERLSGQRLPCKSPVEPTPHLNLSLITSINRSNPVHVDVLKKVVHEIRHHCCCLLCEPPAPKLQLAAPRIEEIAELLQADPDWLCSQHPLSNKNGQSLFLPKPGDINLKTLAHTFFDN